MTTKVFPIQEALAAVNASVADTWVFTPKKPNPNKDYKCQYVGIGFNIGDQKNKPGWFSARDIVLTAGVADKADKNDPRNKYASTRANLESSVSNSNGVGEFLLKSNPNWLATVEKQNADGTIVLGKRDIHGLVQTHYSADNKDPAKRNQPKADPNVRFQFSFDTFSANLHGHLAGKQKTQFFDYSKKYTDANGKTQYEQAKVNVNGKDVLVNDDNLHLFVKRGSIIRELIFNIGDEVLSGGWVSAPILAHRVVLEQGPDAGFDDEFGSGASVNLPEVKAATTGNNTNDALVDNALNELGI